MLESALRAAGMRTGLFTSPHLVDPTERIQVDGQPVSRELFAWAFMAFLLFEDLAAQTVALEVGLGGRLDATNVVLPRVSVITPIDYDHEAFLGRSVEAIAGEKAGIIKPGVPVVIGPQRPSVDELLAARPADEESANGPPAHHRILADFPGPIRLAPPQMDDHPLLERMKHSSESPGKQPPMVRYCGMLITAHTTLLEVTAAHL